jgi:ribosomal protein S18 acetylase RimI-like enzyme
MAKRLVGGQLRISQLRREKRQANHALVRPAAKTVPTFALRPAAPPDDGFLLRLYGETRADELRRTGWDTMQSDAFLRQQFHARRADHRARFSGAEESVVMIEGEDAGVWSVWSGPAEIRLVNIELAIRHRGRGVGAELVRRLLAEGKKRGLPVVLNVREENILAQRLYRRLGFTPQVRADGYLAMRVSPKKE